MKKPVNITEGIGISVPAFFSDKFTVSLAKLQQDKKGNDYIDNVYGSPRNLILGQARASQKIPNLSFNELTTYIGRLHSIGIKFNFTLNSIWSNNIERDSEHIDKILNEIKCIIDTGVDALIIGNLYIADLVNREFGSIKTIGSINLKTDSAYKLNSLLTDYNFDKVVLDRTVNRNISLLQNLNGSHNERIVLLANPDCIFDCPLSQYHMLENGHSSMNPTAYSDKNYCIDYCQKKYMDSPSEILKTPWVHPSDLDLYEKVGIKFLKIQGRTLPENKILELVNLYLNRLKSNNFVEIFPNFIGKKQNEYKFPIFNSKIFNQRTFIESFFINEITCKNVCGLQCKKCDILVSNLIQK